MPFSAEGFFRKHWRLSRSSAENKRPTQIWQLYPSWTGGDWFSKCVAVFFQTQFYDTPFCSPLKPSSLWYTGQHAGQFWLDLLSNLWKETPFGVECMLGDAQEQGLIQKTCKECFVHILKHMVKPYNKVGNSAGGFIVSSNFWHACSKCSKFLNSPMSFEREVCTQKLNTYPLSQGPTKWTGLAFFCCQVWIKLLVRWQRRVRSNELSNSDMDCCKSKASSALASINFYDPAFVGMYFDGTTSGQRYFSIQWSNVSEFSFPLGETCVVQISLPALRLSNFVHFPQGFPRAKEFINNNSNGFCSSA